MTESHLGDQKEREAIVSDLKNSFFVEAGAGSGKTTSLVHRMVALIKNGECSIGEIAAITFTRKAASELRQRFQNELEKAYQEVETDEQEQRLAEALANLHLCFLGTIHAFCSRLLWERPIEAGIDGDFEVLEDTDSIVQQAWDRYLLKVRLSSPELLRSMEEMGFSLDILQQNYKRLLLYTDVHFPADDVEKPDFKAVLNELQNLVSEAGKEIPDPPYEGRYDNLQTAILKGRRMLRFVPLHSSGQIVHLLQNFEKDTFKLTQKLWPDKEKAKECNTRFLEFSHSRLKPVLRQWREHCYKRVLDFLFPAVQEFKNLKHELGIMDYQDLLMTAAHLLKENKEVRSYFQKKYPKLFVDEFQDTDPIQSEIMLYLTGDNPEEENWQDITIRPGALFVVGDPKQSIYRFRRADLNVYYHVKQQMAQSDARSITLTSNFRSVASIGKLCNDTFRHIFAGEENPYQAVFEPMETVKEDQSGNGVYVLQLPESLKKKDEIIEEESKQIAQAIAYLMEQYDFQPKDFLVLLLTKENMAEYAKALANEDIPVRMSGGSSLANNKDVQDLVTLCRALAHPDDKLSLVTVLRGMFFGFSDAELVSFKKRGGKFHFWSPMPLTLNPNLEGLFAGAYAQLQKYHQWTQSLSPAAALENIINHLGLIPYSLTGELGESQCGHVLQVLEMVREAEHHRTNDWVTLVEYLEQLLDGTLESEIGITSTYDNAIRLMNLHKAKGLEAEVVFLANPARGESDYVDLHVKRIDGEATGYLPIIDRKKYSSQDMALPRGWEALKEEEKRYNEAEKMRLRYVAASRAKQMLIITESKRHVKKNPWQLFLEGDPLKPLRFTTKSTSPQQGQGNVGQPKEDDFSRVMQDLGNATYTKLSPTDAHGPKVHVDTEGQGGLAWGNVVHYALEAYVKGTSDLKGEMRRALMDNAIELDRLGELEKAVDLFKAEMGQRLERAQLVLTEVPFSLHLKPPDPLLHLFASEKITTDSILLNGIIDLVLKENDTWSIIDYKSDRVKTTGDLEALTEMYRNQVAVYAGAWEAITWESVSSFSLYFLYSNTLITIPWKDHT